MASRDLVEILRVAYLGLDRCSVEEFRHLSRSLGIGLGWHYLLDLSWAAQQLAPISPGMKILDAGAGMGAMQWWLADQGVNVISVDRGSRRNLPVRFRQRYPVQGWREEDMESALKSRVRGLLPSASPRLWPRYPKKLMASLSQLLREASRASGKGKVFIYNQGLADMPDVPNASVDAIVSISSLEHNSPDALRMCVQELMRVLKPGGRLVATLGASKDHDWFHEPSQGWCYTEATLRDTFALPVDCPSNYDKYDQLFQELNASEELRGNLADFYYKSGNNGMPWGRWDPQYQSVGVVKTKAI